MLPIKFRDGNPAWRISGFVKPGGLKEAADETFCTANASIKPEQVSIEGLARHAVLSLHAQQAGSLECESRLRIDDLLMRFCGAWCYRNTAAKRGSYSPSVSYWTTKAYILANSGTLTMEPTAPASPAGLRAH